MGWLEDAMRRQRAAQEAAQREQLQRQQAAQARSAEPRRHTQEEALSKNVTLLNELGVVGMLRDLQQGVWRGGNLVSKNHVSKNRANTRDESVSTTYRLEFSYNGGHSRSTGRERNKSNASDRDGMGQQMEYEYEFFPGSVIDGIEITVNTDLTDLKHKHICVSSLMGVHGKEGYHQTLLSEPIYQTTIDHEEKQRLKTKIEDAIARDVLRRQNENRLPATLQQYYGGPKRKSRGWI